MPAQPRPPAKPRLLYIDNLRIVLISMVVLLHLAITYGATGDWWYNEEVPESVLSGVALTLYTTIAQAFTLAFFMMISSYFCPPAYDKKGPRAFAKDKLKRLGIPFLFYFAVLNPILVMMVHVFDGQPAMPPGNRALALFALGVGLVTFVVRLVFPVGYWLEPFHFQLAQFPQYIAYFVAGLVRGHTGQPGQAVGLGGGGADRGVSGDRGRRRRAGGRGRALPGRPDLAVAALLGVGAVPVHRSGGHSQAAGRDLLPGGRRPQQQTGGVSSTVKRATAASPSATWFSIECRSSGTAAPRPAPIA